jgi:hypothetical protein
LGSFDGHQDEEETEDGDSLCGLEETTTAANVDATNNTGMKMPAGSFLRYHAPPRPSPTEENPSTIRDDEESDQFPEEDQCHTASVGRLV